MTYLSIDRNWRKKSDTFYIKILSRATKSKHSLNIYITFHKKQYFKQAQFPLFVYKSCMYIYQSMLPIPHQWCVTPSTADDALPIIITSPPLSPPYPTMFRISRHLFSPNCFIC